MDLKSIDAELVRARRQGPAKDITIPPCPQLLEELQKVMAGHDPDPAEIARIASADVALAAGLLKTANSPLYARARNADTVEQAISMLGMAHSASVLTAFLARNAIRVNSPVLERFWETSTWRALACAYIARQLSTMEPGVAQTFGLFCHVGMPIMMQSVKGYGGTLVEAWARHDRSFTATENSAHRTDHAVVGAIVARAWHLPQSITVAVRLHHDFSVLTEQRIPADVQSLVAIGLVAEHLVQTYLGLKPLIEWERYGEACTKALGVEPFEIDEWGLQLGPQFDAAAIT